MKEKAYMHAVTESTFDTKGLSRLFPEKELRQFFQKADTNRDGRLSKPELTAAFRSLGAIFPRFRAYQGMAKADDNGDGYIDLTNDELDDLIKFALSLGYKYKE